jgi:hypothetical protein
MKSFLFLNALLLSCYATAEPINATNWAQPPLACIEEVIPAIPDRPCPDLSNLPNPGKDDPTGLPADELAWWKSQKFALNYCRAVEIFRREKEKPGSMTPGSIEVSWMRLKAVENSKLKVQAVYDAGDTYQVPPHILTGALMQESIFANLGVADDGGNFSCGIAQINLTEWCHWAEAQPKKKKSEMGWPTGGVDCGVEAVRSHVKPFYEAGLKKIGSLPTYRLEPEHTKNIPFETVAAAWPEASKSEKQRRYKIANSFLNYCGNANDAIKAKAYELRLLYSLYVPTGLKQHEVYPEGQKFNKQCLRLMNSKTFPVQTAWLVAVGAYNAGAKVQDAMAATNRWSKSEVTLKTTFADFNKVGFTPKDLVSSIWNVGEYNASTQRVEFLDLEGNLTQWKPFKVCILQRHLARVVQHVTKPGVAPLVESLEGTAGCKP